MAETLETYEPQPQQTNARNHKIKNIADTAVALESASRRVRRIVVDNRRNDENSCAFKLFDDATVTVGTDPATLVLTCGKKQRCVVMSSQGLEGVFATANSAACVSDPGKTGAVAPGAQVNAEVVVGAA